MNIPVFSGLKDMPKKSQVISLPWNICSIDCYGRARYFYEILMYAYLTDI